MTAARHPAPGNRPPHVTPPLGMGRPTSPRPWESAIGNGESGRKTSPHRTPPPLFFTAASPRFIIPHSHDSPFPIADSQGRGDVGRPIPKGGVTWGGVN